MPEVPYMQRLSSVETADEQTKLLNELLETVNEDFLKTIAKYYMVDLPLVLGIISAQIKFMTSDLDEAQQKVMEMVETSVCRIAWPSS